MPFANPVTGGNILIRPAIQSPNFVASVSGWQINRDGSAEFNNVTVRGELRVQLGSSYINIRNNTSPTGHPAIEMGPASGFSAALIYADVDTIDTDKGFLSLLPPASITDPFAAKPSFTLYSQTTAQQFTRVDALTNVFEASGFIYEGAATRALATAPSAAVTPGNTLTVVSRTIQNTDANAYYAIEASWHGLTLTGPVAVPGNRITMGINRNGTRIRSQRILPQNTTLTQCGGSMETKDQPGGAGSLITYDLVIQAEAASTFTNVVVDASASSAMSVAVHGYQL